MDSPDLGIKNPEPDSTIPIRVLIVEDEIGLGKLLSMQLEVDPHVTPISCTSGEEALKLLRSARERNATFDLVISDHDLGSGMNGLKLAGLARGEFPSIRFTLYTAIEEKIRNTYTPQQLKENGVDRVIRKPAQMASLLEEVRQTRILKQSQSGNPQT